MNIYCCLPFQCKSDFENKYNGRKKSFILFIRLQKIEAIDKSLRGLFFLLS